MNDGFNNKLVFNIPMEYDNITIKEFLKNKKKFSTKMLTRLKNTRDGIILNDRYVYVTEVLKYNDVLVLTLPEDSPYIKPVDISVEVCYEDENMIVFSKPPFMPVHPVKVYREDTLANAAMFYFQKTNQKINFRAVNRLDRNTSGLVLCAKNALYANLLVKNVKKEYTAVCHGLIDESGIIDLPIDLSEEFTTKRVVSEKGKSAVTHYERLYSNGEESVVRLWLETGRTHQIRVHLSHIGHPLLGDDLYGGKTDKINRQALHCSKMVIFDPIKNKEIIVTSSPIFQIADLYENSVFE